MYGLLSHTRDLVDLSWTTRWNPDEPIADPDLRFQIGDGAVMLTAGTTAARSLLEQLDFTLAADGSSYRPPNGLDKRGLLRAVATAEAHAYTQGLSVHVALGIPTPADIPPAPRHPSAVVTGSPTAPAARRRTWWLTWSSQPSARVLAMAVMSVVTSGRGGVRDRARVSVVMVMPVLVIWSGPPPAHTAGGGQGVTRRESWRCWVISSALIRPVTSS